MLTVDQIREKLKDRRLPVVAAACKVEYREVWRIATGKAIRVRPQTLERLSAYLEGSAGAIARH